MTKATLVQVLKDSAVLDGDKIRLSCDAAHKIGAEFDARLDEIGEICREQNIRIKDCQLGCFGIRKADK